MTLWVTDSLHLHWLCRLERSFDSSPGCIWTIFWHDDSDLIADVDTEVRDACKQDAVLTSACFDVVRAVMLDESTDNLSTRDGADLFVNEAAIIRNR